MNKSKTIQKIELIVMILMLVCAVTMLSIHAVRTAQKDAEKFTWQEIKDKLIDDLKNKVTAETAAGRFIS